MFLPDAVVGDESRSGGDREFQVLNFTDYP
jgi:hypothetical protein